MKKNSVVAGILAILCVMSVSGCGDKEAESSTAETTTVVTTEVTETTTQTTTTESTTVTTTAATTTKGVETTIDSNVKLDKTETIDGMSFLCCSEWKYIEKDMYNYWYQNDGGFMMVIAQQMDFSSFSEKNKQEFLSNAYEGAISTSDSYSEYSNVQIDGKPAITFQITIKNVTAQSLIILSNDCSYCISFTESMNGEKTVLSNYIDDITNSMKFEEHIETETESKTEPELRESISYKEGTYKVGTDIPSGEYCIYSTSNISGYYSVNADSKGDSIIGNDNFVYNAFVTVSDGQYLELSRAIAVPVSEIDGVTYKIDTSGSGTFRVGIDIPAGEYKLINEGEDYSGYYCVYNDSEPDTRIVSNDNFEGQTYITVSDGQYLLLSRCKIVK